MNVFPTTKIKLYFLSPLYPLEPNCTLELPYSFSDKPNCASISKPRGNREKRQSQEKDYETLNVNSLVTNIFGLKLYDEDIFNLIRPIFWSFRADSNHGQSFKLF